MKFFNKGKQALFAKGRLKTGEMNKTEAKYAEHLKQLQQNGDICWWKFESIKLRLADNCFYTPDFFVMLNDGTMEMHEVKGAKIIFQDDAKVKVKVAAETFPFVFKVVYPNKQKQSYNGNGWEIVEY